MSDWYWKIIALKTAFILTCFASYLKADETIQKLPYCNPRVNDAAAKNDLVIVSTLDGKLTAFTTQDGVKAWDIETQPLLSSNLYHVELTSGGKWVRLVPSLRGTLYSISGDTIEPLPFDAEQLLSSSFKYSEDLVIAGAHESVWLGLDALTGGVVYECGTSGCNGEQTAGNGRDMLVLRRYSNTVRALDPRSGSEKWNFSVAEHQLALSSSRECLFANDGSNIPAKVSVVVALPDGLVAVKSPDTHLTLWQHKLEAPVAGMWRLQGGALTNIDVLNEATRSVSDVQATPPSLYIGMHNRQLYVQESPSYIQKLETSVATKPVPWKLKQKMYLLTEDNKAVSTLADSGPNALSMITMQGITGQMGDQGFFLYAEETCDQAVQVDESAIDNLEVSPNDSETEHHHIHVHVYSLWFWWKEVLLIAISSALLMNLMIWPRFFAPKFRPVTPLPLNQEVVVVERHYDQPPPRNTTEYSGRFENDFTPVRQLGKGGFGIVFEARNNIDHCSYAVKRITLPKRESKRERVLREVRALAKLEHNNIVRYFNAWLEEPPPGWQEQRDNKLARELEGVSLDTSDEVSTSSVARKDSSVKLNMQKCDSHVVDTLSIGRQSELSKRHRSLSCNDSLSIVFDDNATKPHLSYSDTKDFSHVPSLSKKLSDPEDSFIVFAHSNDQGLSEARNNSYNKSLEKVKEIDDFSKTDSYKKKKGHRRHWSLDLCVKSHERAPPPAKMYLYIQMQLCHRHNLQHWLQHNRDWDSRRDKVKPLFSQIVSAVEYVHLAGLIHRDLKPSNIMFAPDGTVKVGDFGLVTTVGDSQDGVVQDLNASATHSLQVGTHLYMSPEQLSGRPYSYKVDIYSLGVILFELLYPFGTDSERVACLLDLRHKRYPRHFAGKYPQETEVLDLMLSDDPSKRPTASGVRARAPLYQQTDHSWHFTLPPISVAA